MVHLVEFNQKLLEQNQQATITRQYLHFHAVKYILETQKRLVGLSIESLKITNGQYISSVIDYEMNYCSITWVHTLHCAFLSISRLTSLKMNFKPNKHELKISRSCQQKKKFREVVSRKRKGKINIQKHRDKLVLKNFKMLLAEEKK